MRFQLINEKGVLKIENQEREVCTIDKLPGESDIAYELRGIDFFDDMIAKHHSPQNYDTPNRKVIKTGYTW